MAPYDLYESYYDFWVGFECYVRSKSNTVAPPVPKRQHWVCYRVISNVNLCATVSDRENWVKAEVALHYKGDMRAAKFADLEAQRTQIESEVGSRLVWNRHSAKVHLTQPWANPLAADPDEVYGWFLENKELLQRVIIPRL